MLDETYYCKSIPAISVPFYKMKHSTSIHVYIMDSYVNNMHLNACKIHVLVCCYYCQTVIMRTIANKCFLYIKVFLMIIQYTIFTYYIYLYIYVVCFILNGTLLYWCACVMVHLV